MTRAEAAHKIRLSLLGCALCRRIHGPHDPGNVFTENKHSKTRRFHWAIAKISEPATVVEDRCRL